MLTPTADPTAIDVGLLHRIASRDGRAVAELYDRHARLLYSVILRIVHDRAEAEDTLQEVFVRIWERAESYRPMLGSPTAWLVRVARNRAIDRLRARRGARAVEAGQVAEAEAAEGPLPMTPEASTAQAEQQRAIARALADLAPDQRRLIEDAFFLGYTHSELAERFRLPLGTVKTKIRAAVMALRKALEDHK